MINHYARAAVAALMIVLVGGLGACESAGSAATPSPASPPPVSPSAVPSELTAEEDLSINPPAPVDVRAEVDNGNVRLSWQPPPEVTAPHRYSDRVTAYRIYRRGPREFDLRPLGTSTEMSFTDPAPGKGEFAYAVTSIREQDVEGTKSDPVQVVQVS